MARSLQVYRSKRDFRATPEPSASSRRLASKRTALAPPLRFVVQRHRARREHFDLRLELDGVMLSWAVTKGPSANPKTKRLAVRTEDHPISYNKFEGVIPDKAYGAGPVMIWDRGTWALVGDDAERALADGHIKLILAGERMRGRWALVRLKDDKRENWLLIKDRDAFAENHDALAERFKTSVVTNRTFAGILRGAPAKPAKAAPPPAFIPPMLCTMADKPPQGDDWQFEMKYDGYRMQLAIGDGTIALRTRNGHDWTDRFPDIVNAAKTLRFRNTIVDGEAVCFGANGIADYPKFVTALSNGGAGIGFVAFDLMRLDNRDLTAKPLVQRRRALEKIMAGKAAASSVIRLAPIADGTADVLIARVAAVGGEGIIAKRTSSLYRSKRSSSWLKIKSALREDAVVVGYVPSPSGREFASLLVALDEGDGLRFVGGVGSGFTARSESDAMARLSLLRRDSAPTNVRELDAAPANARWVAPELTAAIAFGGFSTDRRLRAARFLGWREDATTKASPTRPRPDSETPSSQPAKPITITHPERVVFPAANFTKGDVAEYYRQIAKRILPHLDQRPVSLLRAPDGLNKETFFQRHPMPAMKRGIRRISADRERGDYFAITDADGLATCVQFGAIEFHGWGAQEPDLDMPDRMVFDLDPSDDVPFSVVKDGAQLIRRILDSAGLRNFPLVSGGKGIHIVVPLDGSRGWPNIEAFTSKVARIVAKAEPDHFLATASKARRKGRIYVDWLRNKRSATAIVPYSLRAREDASIAMPVSWRSLAKVHDAAAFTVKTEMPSRADPWKGFFEVRQTISPAALKVIERFA